MLGKKTRLSRILKDGKTVIIALDHGVEHGPSDFPDAALDPRKIIEASVEGGADAIMMHKGLALRAMEGFEGRISLILKITGKTKEAPNLQAQVASIGDAVSLGADGVAMTVYTSSLDEAAMMEQFGRVEQECRSYGMPLLVLAYPRRAGMKSEDRYRVENVRYAARVVAEIGADVIKTYYTGSTETFRQVIKACPMVPVVAAGGPKLATAKDALELVKSVVDAGGAGVAVGRNVWAHENPVGMTKAICKIVHGNADVEYALRQVF